ncbi:MAG TPA: hypothetical protein DHW82_11110 [Spirochaetia bacterium]|nr:hypothetical protein [Spirochaetia bacterium]
MIKSRIHKRLGNSTTNFETTLIKKQSEIAKQTLKDPYIFDFLTLTQPFQERELDEEK